MRHHIYSIFLDEKKKYVLGLYICKTNKRYDAIRVGEWGFPEMPPGTVSQGCFQGTKITCRRKTKGAVIVGWIALNIPPIRSAAELASVVAHECAHAVAHYMRKIRKWKLLTHPGWMGDSKFELTNPEKIPEELFAYSLGRCVDQITRALKQDAKK